MHTTNPQRRPSLAPNTRLGNPSFITNRRNRQSYKRSSSIIYNPIPASIQILLNSRHLLCVLPAILALILSYGEFCYDEVGPRVQLQIRGSIDFADTILSIESQGFTSCITCNNQDNYFCPATVFGNMCRWHL